MCKILLRQRDLNKLCSVNQFIIYKIANVTKLDRHLTSAFGIADVKAYLGLQRSDDLNPVYVGIWLAFAECRPESPGLSVCYSFLTLS